MKGGYIHEFLHDITGSILNAGCVDLKVGFNRTWFVLHEWGNAFAKHRYYYFIFKLG